MDAPPQLNIAQTMFAVFFAIFWGTSANVWGRWKPFNWPLYFRVNEVNTRVWLSLFVLTAFPIGYFIGVLRLLEGTDCGLYIDALRGIVAALGVFGFYRIWLGWIERTPERFYLKGDNLPALLKDIPCKTRQKIEPLQEELGIDVKIVSGWFNCGFGIGYVIVGLAGASIGTFCCR